MKLRVVYRTCDKVFCCHDVTRPFTDNKQTILEVSFNSLLQSLVGYDYTVHVIGDDLSEHSIAFFNSYPHVTVNNMQLGSASKSAVAALDQALQFDDEDWVYTCEDDYLHVPHFMAYLKEFIDNKDRYLELSSRKGNRTRLLTGDLRTKPLFIFPADYPEHYRPRHIYFSLLFLSQHCHWRQIPATTHTFIAQTKDLKKFEKKIRKSVTPCNDSYLSRKVYGKNWLFGKALCVAPIPGLSTHLTEGVMSPFVDWQAYFDANLAEIDALR